MVSFAWSVLGMTTQERSNAGGATPTGVGEPSERVKNYS
jgi:hypothetical protein